MSKTVVKIITITHNLVQFIGWSYVLILGLLEVFTGKSEYLDKLALYKNEGLATVIKTVQLLQSLEILFAVLRFTPTNWVMSLMQIFGRNFIVYGIFEIYPESRWSGLAILSWSLAEIIRYQYYLADDFGLEIPLLTTLRYSAFIILYPTGIIGEYLSIISALPKIDACCPRVYSLSLPNEWNFAFDYRLFTYFMLLVLGPGFINLYMHMLSQRRNKLKGGNTAKSAKKQS